MTAKEAEFPVWGLVPKKETGVLDFLNKYPEYDGRGTIIAIFDSGVDPGAAGLQITTDGKPKLIETYDCSGAGDVDTTTVVTPVNGEIKGLTGRTLKIPESWKNVNGCYRVGVKNAFELYPKTVKERMVKKRKETLWDPHHKLELAESNKRLAEVTAQDSNDSKRLDPVHLLVKEEATARVDILNQFEKEYNDCGPTYDCVLFNNGQYWCACIDTSEKGDLASCKVLGEYSVTRDYMALTKEDQVNVSINVHDDGNLLEIVATICPHGTHVAAIAAAHFPDTPEKNGVAPGAQLVSLTIGDGRLGTMETGTGIIRAAIQLMRWCNEGRRIHVINMSYAEFSNWSNTGRVGEIMSEIVDKYGIVWVCGAGNNGPALCTIGTPPDIATDALIGVGAYVSPEMMVAEYSMRKVFSGMSYTWSSRGPTADGARGVAVCAPGGAITSVPTSTLSGSQMMNGTSMAAPHCAGCIAVVLSGVLSRNLPYNPFQVKRALENSALFLADNDLFAQGTGLVQVEKTFEYLENYHNVPERNVRFCILCGPNNAKGIILRHGPLKAPVDCPVVIEPVFFNADEIDPEEKINFQISLNIVCDVPWVSCSNHLQIMNFSRPLSVRIDPAGLEPGVHQTRIRAYDSKLPQRGPVFTVEVTVFQPVVLEEGPCKQNLLEYKKVLFHHREIKRHFIWVPNSVTWAVLRIQGVDRDKESKFLVHCTQKPPKKSFKKLEYYKSIQCSDDFESQSVFKVQGGLILEVAIAKWWSEVDAISLDYSIQFFGVKPDQSTVTMHHAAGIHRITLQGNLREIIAPSVQLEHSVSVLRPTSGKVSPFLSKRDIIPDKRVIYQLLLTYSFHVSKATEVFLCNGYFSDTLYECDVESQLWFIYNSNKQLLVVGGSYPDKYAAKLEKGDYTVKHQLRHEKADLLEKYVDTPLFCYQKLPSPLSLDVYSSESAAITHGKKLAVANVTPARGPYNVYISALPNDKLLKNSTPGQFLSGTISYSKDGRGKKVNSYPFKYILTEFVKNNNAKSEEKEKPKMEDFIEAKKDFLTSWISKLDGVDESETLFNKIVEEFPDHLPAQLALLQKMEPDSASWNLAAEYSPSITNLTLKITDAVTGKINQAELLAFLGIKNNLSPDAPAVKSSMDKKRNILVEALGRRGVAMCRFLLESEGKEVMDDDSKNLSNVCTLKNVDDLWFNILKFVDSSDPKGTHFFALWHAAVHKNYGRLMKLLAKMNEEKPSKTIEESIIWTASKAGWTHILDYVKMSLPTRYPESFRIC